MKPLRVYLPLKRAIITQGFGKEFNSVYASQGLLGHPAIDFVSYVSDEILTCVDGAYTYKTINKNNPDLSKYRCIYQVAEFIEGVFEFSFGHCNDIHCILGPAELGKGIGTMGNTGEVYAGGREITTAEKKAGSKLGTHLHLQCRKVQKVTQIRGGHQYLNLENGEELVLDGFYFEVVNYYNGYNGCIDFAKYIVQEAPVAERTPAPAITEHYDQPYKPVPPPIIKDGKVTNWFIRSIALLYNGLKDFYNKGQKGT